jgi:hypothetical protein
LSESDADSLSHLFARVDCAVRGGCWDEEEIFDDIEQSVEMERGADKALVGQLKQYAQGAMQEQDLRETTWNDPTMNDAIDRACEELNAAGIVALQNAGYTQSDGWADVNEVAADQPGRPRGAVFYHGQDLERGVAGKGLWLAFGTYEDDDAKRDAAGAVIGREICQVLARHGVPVEWDGSVDQRLSIPPFEWRKRRRTERESAA